MDEEVFTQAPEEVTRYFEQKGDQPTFDWRDIAPEEHARTFTVAKTAGFDVLSDIRSAVNDAIKNQQSFEEFRQNIEPTLRAKGWWGRNRAVDPTSGAPVLSQLGSLRRLRTIHWANVTTARAAGEWERIQRTKNFLPFLKYTLSVSERRRPEHEGWVNIILPVDDDWWLTHYPPNGWLCKCGVRQITRQQAERDGYDPSLPPPIIETRPWFNARTGQTVHVPIGIDPGWQTNPGFLRAQNAANFLGDTLGALGEESRRIAIADIVGSRGFRSLIENRSQASMIAPIAPTSSAMIESTGTKARHVFLSSSSAIHILDEHAERGLQLEDFMAAAGVLASPEEIKSSRNSMVFIGTALGLRWRATVKFVNDEAWLTSFHRKSRKRK